MCKRSMVVLLCILLGSGARPASAADDDPTMGGWWKLDEGSGAVAHDASGNGNDGTLTGNPAWVPGNIGGALEFDGTGDWVDCGDDASLNITGPLTIAVWARSAVAGEGGANVAIASRADDAATWAWQLRYNAPGNNYMGFQFNANPGGSTWVAVEENLEPGQWYHIAATFDGADVKCHLNGVEKASAGMTAILGGASRFYIGQDGWYNVYNGAVDDLRIYARALTTEELLEVMEGASEQSSAPVPEDGAVDVLRDVVLGWTAAELAATHDVYFGTVSDDVNNASRTDPRGVLVSQGQPAASYDPPGMLDLGTTYYWRVDEVNAAPDYTIFKGEVWSFTTEPVAYPVEDVTVTSNAISDAGAGPENTINGSGLNADDLHSTKSSDMWLGSAGGAEPIWLQYDLGRVCKLHEMLVWNYNVVFEAVLGFGVSNATVEYSADGAEWASLGDVELAQATSQENYAANTAVDLGGVAARYVKLTINDNWGMLTQYGLSEVRFLYIPVQAREAQPADGAADVAPDATLGWRAGREAASHEVYLGTDPAALALVDTVGQTSFAPGSLDFGTTYYWRIDEVNATASPPVWAGDLWSFSTQEYALIDGFETYDDDIDAMTTIFDTWVDGWVNDNGSTVGYFDAPFAEQTIVRTGGQSMPLAYDNTGSPFYSEAERTFDVSQDWTVGSADTLVVYFQGVPGPFAELASGKVVMGAAGADIWNTADEFRFAYKPLNGNGAIVALVESIANTDVWAKGGVMIRETLEAGSAFAAVYATPGNGCRFQGRLTTNAAAVSDTSVATAEQIAMAAPYWVKIERVGNAFNGYYSTDGEDWTAMSWNPQTIAMASNAYIGLALTSHAAGVLGSAEFSDVATTGNVTGSWAVATIGPEQPEGNGAGELYVTLEDATGATATATHPAGEGAVFLADWNEWQIPLSDFTGVNLSRVGRMIIGVGDRANPTAGGAGIVYIDDIGYGRPRNVE